MSFRSTMLALLGGAAVIAAGPATPTLVQHVASSANPPGVGISENNNRFNLPNPVGAGNCLVLCITYPNANTPTVTDDNGNTWPAAAVTASGGTGNFNSSIFVLPNANAGLTHVTVAFGVLVIPFQYDLSEFNNIATTSPVNGTTSVAVTASSSNTLSAGSFTPTVNNDANGGNVILSYHCVGASAGGNPTTWAAGSGFTLLEADIAWTSGQGIPHASQWQVQATRQSVTCSIGETGDATSVYNSVALALKVASAGTPAASGIYINKILHFTNQSFPATLTIHTPTVGNLMVITTTNPTVSAISDSDGGAWTIINPVGGAVLAYSVNRTANPNRKVTLTNSGGAVPVSFRVYDISGAAAAPFDVSASTPSTNLNAVTTFSGPSITPTTSNGLVIAAIQLGQGPGLDVTSPVGAVFDLQTAVCLFTGSVSGTVLTAGTPTRGTIDVGAELYGAGIIQPNPSIASFGTGSGGAGTYNLSASPGTIGSEAMQSGESDQDLMENADGNAHFYNPGTSTLNFSWTITNQSTNSGTAVAAAFKHA